MAQPNIVETIRLETRRYRYRTAVIEGARQITYAELFAAVDAMAGALRQHGVAALDRVALLCADGADYISASLAVLSNYSVVVPLSPVLTDREVAHTLERMDIHFVLCDARFRDKPAARPLNPRHRLARPLYLTPYGSRREEPVGYAELNPAFIRFSSGTTGASKGVLLSHDAILERTAAADTVLRMSAADVVLSLLSMSYHFVVSILLFLRRATTIVMCQDSYPAVLQEGLARHGGTFIYASPYHYHVLLASRDFNAAAFGKVRLAIATATDLPVSLAERFAARFGLELSGAYGIIEVGLPSIDAGEKQRKAGSVGKVLPGYSLRILEPDRAGRGRILLKGPGMFDAYFSPWKRRAEILMDGWFDTGDVGYLDDDGFLFLVGREKNVINFSGMKVFPYEVEAVINQHPAVRESLVCAEPHAVFGQLPIAKVVVEEKSVAAGVEKDLRRFCFERLAIFKVPVKFEIVPELKRTASNKIVRK